MREKTLKALRAPDKRDTTKQFGIQIYINKINPMKSLNTKLLYK